MPAYNETAEARCSSVERRSTWTSCTPARNSPIYLLQFGRQLLLPEPFAAQPPPPPPFSRCVTAATDVVMIGGGGRSTGADARRLSIEKDRNTLRGLLDVSGDAGGWMPVAVTTAAAAAAEFSAVAAPGDADVTFPAVSGCTLFDAISF